MSDREFEAELKKLNTPYSEKSPVVNHRTRKYLTNLSFIVADAWRLSDTAEYCLEIVNGDLPDSLPDLGRLIHPGEDANRNCICVYMRKLGAQMIRYGEGNCPRHTVVIRASQAAATLIAKLKGLYRDKSLLRAQLQLEDIFRLVAYHGQPTHTPDEYRTHVTNLVEGFLRNLTEYAEKLEDHVGAVIERRTTAREQAKQTAASEQISKAVKEDVSAIRKTTDKTDRKVDIVIAKQEETRKTVNRLDKRDKTAKKHSRLRFTIDQQELAFRYWEMAQRNPKVKELTENGRKLKHEHAFIYYKDELVAADFRNAQDYDDCLGCRSDRLAYARRHKSK